MREEAAQRRGKFFAAPVSGLAGLVQVIRLETGTRGPEHGARKWKELNGLTITDTLRDPETRRFFALSPNEPLPLLALTHKTSLRDKPPDA